MVSCAIWTTRKCIGQHEMALAILYSSAACTLFQASRVQRPTGQIIAHFVGKSP